MDEHKQPDWRVRLAAYDAGLLGDYGGGNVEWWQDYIRAELGRAHDFYLSQQQSGRAPTRALPVEGEVTRAEHSTYSDNVGELVTALEGIDRAREAMGDAWVDNVCAAILRFRGASS